MQKLWSESLAFLLSPQSKLYVPKNTDTHIPHPILFPHLHNDSDYGTVQYPKDAQNIIGTIKGFIKENVTFLLFPFTGIC